MKGKDAMTSAQLHVMGVLAMIGVACLLGACSDGSVRLSNPQVLTAPYDREGGELIWGVAPLRNESGTSTLDALSVTDSLVHAIEQVRGIRTVPVNRAIETMRSLEMHGVSTPADAKRLAQAMGVDALVVGSITAWDPYDPPVIGLTLALHADPGVLVGTRGELDSQRLTRLSTEYDPAARSRYLSAPVTVASDVLDARDHGVLLELREYADGRSDTESALGWKVYTASMELYTQFAAYHAVRTLLDQEWVRLARAGKTATANDD